MTYDELRGVAASCVVKVTSGGVLVYRGVPFVRDGRLWLFTQIGEKELVSDGEHVRLKIHDKTLHAERESTPPI